MHNAQQMAEFFKELRGKKVLITTHAAPDGDAIGSVSAMAYLLAEVGAETKILLIGGCPDNLKWILPPGHDDAKSDGPDNLGKARKHLIVPRVRRFTELARWVPDVFVVVDCGDGERPGGEIADFFVRQVLPSSEWANTVTVNIDHHLKNPMFATYNICEPHKAATAEIIGDIARNMQVPLADAFGEGIYVGLVTDTGNFTFSNTTAHALTMAAEIVENGLEVARMTDKLYNNWSIARMNLWGQLMSEMSLHLDESIARSVISLALLEKHGAGKADLEGFAGWMRHLSGVRASLLVREDAPGKVKISVRSMGDVDVRAVAESFGGGGHKAAAGATLDLPVQEAADVVLERLIEEVRNTASD